MPNNRDFDDFTSLEEAEVAYSISRHVFANEFKHLSERLDKQEGLSFNIIIGVVVGAFLVVVGIAYSTWLFMAEYDKSFQELTTTIQSEMNALRTENFEFKKEMLNEKYEQGQISTKP